MYLDDILIYSWDESKYVEHVKAVLHRLREAGLYAKPSKYSFHTKHIEFLSFIITLNGIVIDPIRVQAIEEWPKPESYRDIQVFLGFANFYHYFIYDYSGLAHMLNAHIL
jgi:hypothetical protein